MFGVSISGDTEDVTFLLQEAHEKKARTVLLTAKNKPEFDSFCDEVMLLPSLIHLNHGNVISPQFPILLMTDIFYSCYVSQDKYSKEILHDSTLRALGKTGRPWYDPKSIQKYRADNLWQSKSAVISSFSLFLKRFNITSWPYSSPNSFFL